MIPHSAKDAASLVASSFAVGVFAGLGFLVSLKLVLSIGCSEHGDQEKSGGTRRPIEDRLKRAMRIICNDDEEKPEQSAIHKPKDGEDFSNDKSQGNDNTLMLPPRINSMETNSRSKGSSSISGAPNSASGINQSHKYFKQNKDSTQKESGTLTEREYLEKAEHNETTHPTPNFITEVKKERKKSFFSEPDISSSSSSKKKNLEILVHNVSHTDMIISLCRTNDESRSESFAMEDSIFCRPRFSAFDHFSQQILSAIELKESRGSENDGRHASMDFQSGTGPSIISFPRYGRSNSSPRYSLVTPDPTSQSLISTGFGLNEQNELTRVKSEDNDLAKLRIRGKDLSKMETDEISLKRLAFSPQRKGSVKQTSETMNEKHDSGRLDINGVFFPLLSPLIPLWNRKISEKYGHSLDQSNKDEIKKVVILVTGVGTPRNWTHSIDGNSTEACAELMERFITRLYPDITVQRIHSNTNLFRYDENIAFTKEELVPCIESYRDAHATGDPYPDEEFGDKTFQSNSSFQSGSTNKDQSYNPEWRDAFHVTLSFADGSTARTHAIQSALRPYRPTYFHFWQLKTFWHESKISDEDIEVLSFEDVNIVPAMELSKSPNKVQMVAMEMQKFKAHFLESAHSEHQDLAKFWLRKSQKPVLAVLLVEKDGNTILYRGTNMEVSMPTGSLCAERNVIGSALADNPGLKREDLKMIAVLSVPMTRSRTAIQQKQVIVRRPPVEIDRNKCTMINDGESSLEKRDMKKSMSVASFASIIEDYEQNDGGLASSWILPEQEGGESIHSSSYTPTFSSLPSNAGEIMPLLDLNASADTLEVDNRRTKQINVYSSSDADSDTCSDAGSRRPAMGVGRMQKKTVLVQTQADINPLRPCGSCNEWLKKIAEPNPNFKVITFTDADCNGVYVSPVID